MASRAVPATHARLPLATFRFWAQYFRFETEGFEVLAGTEPSLIVGYHGGPWTFDLWMLGARMYDELGYFPRASWHPIRRRGYLRLAYAHDLPIIPVVASGLDETFLGLNDGHALSKLLFGRQEVPAWLALGVGGIWPLALPFPVKIRQRIGTPIRLGSLQYSPADGDESLEKIHAHVTATLQSMLDALRHEPA